GEMVAVGLQNGNVYVYDVEGNGEFNLRDNGTLKKNPQTLQFGLGPIQNIVPLSPNRFLLSVTDSPVIVEIKIKTNG
ncbi:unnamed protein product, partial [Didymodactylos carnosus]